jgi:hypothetical protein
MEEDSSGAKKGESDEKKKWQVGCSTAASHVGLSYVFGSPGSASGSVSHKYGSGSGSESFPFLVKALSGVK